MQDIESEFTELIQKNSRIIHKAIGLYIDTKEDKQDVFQEIMLQAWQSYKNYRGDAAFRTWLYRVSLNTVLNHLNKKQRKINTIDFDYKDPIGDSQGIKEDHELLYFLIKQLNEMDRTIMTLHLDGYKNIEIADMLGINQNHVNVKVYRLKNQIIDSYKSINI